MTLEISRLICLDCCVYCTNANLKESVPQAGIPFGYSFSRLRVLLYKVVCWKNSYFFLFNNIYTHVPISFSGRFVCNKLSFISCKLTPSITCKGSITFPSDLDILRPCASRTLNQKISFKLLLLFFFSDFVLPLRVNKWFQMVLYGLQNDLPA